MSPKYHEHSIDRAGPWMRLCSTVSQLHNIHEQPEVSEDSWLSLEPTYSRSEGNSWHQGWERWEWLLPGAHRTLKAVHLLPAERGQLWPWGPNLSCSQWSSIWKTKPAWFQNQWHLWPGEFLVFLALLCELRSPGNLVNLHFRGHKSGAGPETMFLKMPQGGADAVGLGTISK